MIDDTFLRCVANGGDGKTIIITRNDTVWVSVHTQGVTIRVNTATNEVMAGEVQPKNKIHVTRMQWKTKNKVVMKLTSTCLDISGARISVKARGLSGESLYITEPITFNGEIDPCYPDVVVCTISDAATAVPAYVQSPWQTEDQHRIRLNLPPHLWFRMSSVADVSLIQDGKAVMRVYKALLNGLGAGTTNIANVNSPLFKALVKAC